MEIRRRHRSHESKLRERNDRKRFRAGDNELLGEVEGEERGKGCVEWGGEGGGAQTNTEVCVVASFVREDGGGVLEEVGIVD